MSSEQGRTYYRAWFIIVIDTSEKEKRSSATSRAGTELESQFQSLKFLEHFQIYIYRKSAQLDVTC